jgi:hypothetical protein
LAYTLIAEHGNFQSVSANMKDTSRYYSPELYQLLNTEDAAALLDVSPRLLEKKRQEGNGLPFVRLSPKCVRYRLIDLIKFQEAHLQTNTIYAPSGVPDAPSTTAPEPQPNQKVVPCGAVTREGTGD